MLDKLDKIKETKIYGMHIPNFDLKRPPKITFLEKENNKKDNPLKNLKELVQNNTKSIDFLIKEVKEIKSIFIGNKKE